MSKENYLSRDDLLELAKLQAATISLLIFEKQDLDEAGVTAKDLDAAQARIEELQNYLDDARDDLDTARDARDKAEREANDVRSWLRGLVKGSDEVPNRWPVVAETKIGVSMKNFIEVKFNRLDVIRWFDPSDVFEAYDAEYKRMADENSVQG